MSALKGITVTLFEKTETGRDPFNAPIYETVPVEVENVLVAPGDSANIDTNTTTRLHGKRVRYTLALPKGDAHHWEDSEVEFFGQRFLVVGFESGGIEKHIPLDWNRKVHVERYV